MVFPDCLGPSSATTGLTRSRETTRRMSAGLGVIGILETLYAYINIFKYNNIREPHGISASGIVEDPGDPHCLGFGARAGFRLRRSRTSDRAAWPALQPRDSPS